MFKTLLNWERKKKYVRVFPDMFLLTVNPSEVEQCANHVYSTSMKRSNLMAGRMLLFLRMSTSKVQSLWE